MTSIPIRYTIAAVLIGTALLPACSKPDDSTNGPRAASAPGNGITPAPSATSPRAASGAQPASGGS
ncbi:MAG: hypothetical protein V4764_04440 [Burkholderia sp.]